MSIDSPIVPAVYTGNGTAGPFAFGWKITSEDDIQVTIRDTTDASDNGTLLAKDAVNGYTVAGVGVASGGSITLTGTFATSVTSDYKLMIRDRRSTVVTDDLRNNDDYNGPQIQSMVEKLARDVNTLREDVDLAVRLPDIADDQAPGAFTNGRLPLPIASGIPLRNGTNDGWLMTTAEDLGLVSYVTGNIVPDIFTAGVDFTAGTTTQLTLSQDPVNKVNTQVYFDAGYQQQDTYTVSGTTITFDNPIPTSTSKVTVVMLTVLPVGTPSDDSVATASIQDGAVTEPKLATNAVSTIKIQDNAVTNAKIAPDAVTSTEIADNAVGASEIDETANITINDLTLTGVVKFNTNFGDITSDTSDSTDNKRIRLCGGGAISGDRGGRIEMYGNETGGWEGVVNIYGGDTATNGAVVVHTGTSVQRMVFTHGGEIDVLNTLDMNNNAITNIGSLSAVSLTGDVNLNGNKLVDVSQMDAGTSDGTDDGSITICGGGDAAISRGGYLVLRGNEDIGNGAVSIVAGDDAAGGDIDLVTGAGVTRVTVTYGGEIDLFGNLDLNSNDITAVNSLTLNATTSVISTDTADTADSKLLVLAGGGGNSVTRGAMVACYGNEYAGSEGRVDILAGNDSADGSIRFSTGAGTNRLRIEYGGEINALSNVDLNGNDITAVNSIGLTGGQIAFPATQNASSDANTLDDYEEGTFTPVVWDSTQSDAEGQTYTVQQGYYTKIGNMVHFTLQVILSSAGTLTGSDEVRIGGLPFNSSSETSSEHSVSIGLMTGLSMSSANVVGGFIAWNTNRIFFREWNSTSGNGNSLSVTEFSTPTVYISGSYRV